MFVKHNCSKAFEIVKNNQALNFYAPFKIKYCLSNQTMGITEVKY